MRRLGFAVTIIVLAAASLAAWSFAAPAGKPAATHAVTAVKLPKLPALPADVKNRHRWVIGVKCDFPPFGFIDVRGRNDGYDVQIARRFTQLAFGRDNRLSLVCVTTPSRIPTLQSNRVDMIISTLTWTQARADVIDFSTPYYSATGRLLVPNNSSIAARRDLHGKTVVTTRGSIYATYLKNCIKDANVLEVDGTAAAVLAVKNGQADTFMFDDAFVLGVATQDPSLKLTSDKFLNIPWGIGIRKGDSKTVAWVNTALRRMQLKNEFVGILKANTPAKYVGAFVDNVPGPKTRFAYPVGKDPASDCSGI
jgi:polar amino acid transport system substrate-binding protein